MAWFGQGKDTVEWQEFRDDVLFYKWPGKEIKKGAKLNIRPGQRAIFFFDGAVEGMFDAPGSYDIESEIVPFLSTLKGIFNLRGDSGMRAEIYFVNNKELLLPWGTPQRIMIPTAEVPGGIPVGCNGNMIITFKDYHRFLINVAGVRSTYSLDDVSQRIMGELSPIVAEAILGGEQAIGLNILLSLQQNSRKMGKYICKELDEELSDFGLGVVDVNILSINYPAEVQKMVDKVASQAFIGDLSKYASVGMVDSMEKGNGANNPAMMGTQFAMGQQMAKQINKAMEEQPKTSGGDRFCPTCRKMTVGKFCSECGTATV